MKHLQGMKHSLYLTILLCILVVGCGKQTKTNTHGATLPEHTACRAIYYWKHTFALSNYEKQFLERHDIKKMYIRFFDVSIDNDYRGDGPVVVPSATVSFHDSLPKNTQIVPTVYVTTDAMRFIADRQMGDSIAEEMYHRIKNMCSYNNINKVEEIQVDCDWTTTTQQPFFLFCQHLRDLCHKDGRLLSATIRLHQLRLECPPVDYGMLMVYNTNDLRKASVRNSILSMSDVLPYLQGQHYHLPLDVAYPAFNWYLAFRNDAFHGIIRSKTEADSLRREGYTIRHEQAQVEDINALQPIMRKHLSPLRRPHSVVLYHLDEQNLKKYTDEEIESVFAD